jgi:peptidoglycan/xylan/chitin deacetylase (PgdA/CDA1 family)
MGRWIAISLLVFLLLISSACESFQRAALPLAENSSSLEVFKLAPPEGDEIVYLTIDDGPSPRTGELLDLLDDHDAGATFFLHTDHIEDPSVLGDIARSGRHNTGHHMPADRDWSEDTALQFRAAYIESFCLLAEGPADYAGWFRPPLGRSNPSTMGPVIAESFGGQDEGLFLLASYLPWDAGGATETPARPLNHQVAKRYGYGLAAAVGPGDIVVFHDGPRARRTDSTMVSLKAFLDRLERRGLTAAALPPRPIDRTLCAG